MDNKRDAERLSAVASGSAIAPLRLGVLALKLEPKINAKTQGRQDAKGKAGRAAGMSLGERARREAGQWEPFTQNDDPVHWPSLRGAFEQGFMRGFSVCAGMKPNVLRQPPPG